MKPHDCLFCDLANGRRPALTAYADDDFCVLADTAPIRPGHLLILTRRHFAYFDDLPEPLAQGLIVLGQRVARALKAATGVRRVGFALTGSDIAHVHAHLVPLHTTVPT